MYIVPDATERMGLLTVRTDSAPYGDELDALDASFAFNRVPEAGMGAMLVAGSALLVLLTNLCTLAAALGISIEELLSRPRCHSKLLRAADVPILKRSVGNVEVHELMPDKVRGIEIDRVEIKANASMTGHPHLQGTKEYSMTLKGEVTVSAAGSQHAVSVGDVLAFPGDQKHGYRNTGAGTAVALSVVLPMPNASSPAESLLNDFIRLRSECEVVEP